MKLVKGTYKRSGIYKIINLLNGKIYIGSAVNFTQRKATHINQLQSNIHHNKHLQAAWNKYGEENFVFEVVEYCEIKQLIAREQHYIDILIPQYNICKTAGSSLGRKQSFATIRQRSHKNRGQKRTVEQLKKFSQAQLKCSSSKSEKMKQKTLDPTYRENMKINGKKNWSNQSYRDKQREAHIAVVSSITHREKLKHAQLERYAKNPRVTKKIYALKNNKVCEVFNSETQCVKKMKMARPTLHKAIGQKRLIKGILYSYEATT